MAETRPVLPKLAPARVSEYRARAVRANPREAVNRAWRYSIFVTVMKGALPVVALGLGVAVLTYVLQSRDQSRTPLAFEQLDKVENDLAMVRPELSGTDNEGRPFTVTAESAVQETRGSDRVVLKGVDAKIILKRGGTLLVRAEHGIADTRTHLLDVSGGIRLTSEDGYEMRTEAAHADLRAGTIEGQMPIEASGKLGHLTANRFAYNQKTGEVRFSGNVRMVLNGAAPKPRGTVE